MEKMKITNWLIINTPKLSINGEWLNTGNWKCISFLYLMFYKCMFLKNGIYRGLILKKRFQVVRDYWYRGFKKPIKIKTEFSQYFIQWRNQNHSIDLDAGFRETIKMYSKYKLINKIIVISYWWFSLDYAVLI